MMARARHFPSRGTGPKRQVTWIGPADQGFIPVATGAKVLIATFDPSTAGLPKPTVVRTRGEVAIAMEANVETDQEAVGAYGVALVSDQAVAAGVASIPGPYDNADWDGWFVWRSWNFVQEAAGTPASLSMMMNAQEVDSKAMRKVSDNETIVLVAESQSGAFRISMPLRLLVKLS